MDLSPRNNPHPHTAQPVEQRAVATEAPQRIEIASQTLFEGGRLVDIRHGDEVYTLRLTRRGKLLLTK
ncbi:MAG: hemin uptake protein HemP [Pseudomonadota bacterium]